MSLLTPSATADERQYIHLSSVDLLEQQLLALGPLPRRDEQRWDAEQWTRYADIVRRLAAELSPESPRDA